jgi:threonine synthase
MLATGAKVFIAPDYEASAAISRECVDRYGWLDRNTGVNPITFEGKKTVAFEIWEQLGRQLPDVVAVPVGDGPTLCGLAKGFRELVACGVTSGVPRLLGVQVDSCAPLVAAWRRDPQTAKVAPPLQTQASGIAVPKPVAGSLAIQDVDDSGGAFVKVSEGAIAAAQSLLLRSCGIVSEPASSAALAGTLAAVEEGLIGRQESIVVLVTGRGPANLGGLSGRETTLEGRTLAEVASVLRVALDDVLSG